MNEYQRIAQLEEEGFFESANTCQKCGTLFMLKVRYYSIGDGWLTQFVYECPYCGNVEVESYTY